MLSTAQEAVRAHLSSCRAVRLRRGMEHRTGRLMRLMTRVRRHHLSSGLSWEGKRSNDLQLLVAFRTNSYLACFCTSGGRSRAFFIVRSCDECSRYLVDVFTFGSALQKFGSVLSAHNKTFSRGMLCSLIETV